jgi:alkanesulfonate monooxygenase SsuD/methylene tetrahydromethanopterin reductase-like flavin-dependent oxidoreductase (luciferase family)
MRELADLCRTAEAFGYDVVLGTDHLSSGSPFSPLIAAAAASERLRVGTLTINNEFWNPALLAREAITVDMLTEGRLELGLGAGHMKWEFESAGIPWSPFAERADRLRQSIEAVRELFTHGVAEPDSAARVREVFGRPELKPVQRHGFGGSGPPLLVGGTGPADPRAVVASHHRCECRHQPAGAAPPGNLPVRCLDSVHRQPVGHDDQRRLGYHYGWSVLRRCRHAERRHGPLRRRHYRGKHRLAHARRR